MFGLFTRPFNSLDESDLIDLVETRKVREHILLEYKKESYQHNREGTIEMLADITAMANASGGYIVIGVEEDETQPDGTPKTVVGIENGDEEALWLQSVCLSSIEERIIDLRVREVALDNGRSCIVIQAPNSIRKPHMIVYQKHRSFRIRHGRAKSFLGMQEVRNMILNINSYRESQAKFIDIQRQKLEYLAKGEPWLLLMATPIYVDIDKIDPLQDDIEQLFILTPGNPDRSRGGISSGRTPGPRIFGIESSHEQKPYERKLRLFRNGHFDYWQSLMSYVPNGWPETIMPVYSYDVTVTVLHFLRVAKQIMQLAEVNEPLTITAHFRNINPSYLDQPKTNQWPDDAFIWRESSLDIEFTVNDLSDPSNTARLVVDRLFNAFGYRHNPHFDPQGEFVLAR